MSVPPKFRIAPMSLADIPAVIALEQIAYPISPRRDYSYELQQNSLAQYFLLYSASQVVDGVGGFWLIADELHIITLAVHPRRRRSGRGERLLGHLLEEGIALGAGTATLEVRVSNQAALHLYQKYGFREVGRRSGYYSDEDALILTASLRKNNLSQFSMLSQ